MRISVAADSRDGIAPLLPGALERLGHEVTGYGALAPDAGAGAGDDAASLWSACARAAALDVAEGRAAQAVVACWTGTGVSIAANKVPGITVTVAVTGHAGAGPEAGLRPARVPRRASTRCRANGSTGTPAG